MRTFKLFFKYSPRLLSLAVVIGIVGGAVSAGLMALINHRLSHSGPESWRTSVWGFAGLVTLVLLCNYAARTLTLRLATRSAADLRMSFSQQILALPLRRHEEMGSHRFMALLTEDLPNLCAALLKIPELAISLTLIVGCMAYLTQLSPALSGVLLIYVILGIVITKIPESRAEKLLRRAREYSEVTVGLFEAMNAGMKQLKLHTPRREAFVREQMSTSVDSFRKNSYAGQRIYALTQSWGQSIYFIFIGFILYGFSTAAETTPAIITGYTLTLLYMRSPILNLLAMQPSFAKAKVALAKIESLELSLEALKKTGRIPCGAPPVPTDGTRKGCRLDLIGVTHTYRRQEGHCFNLGPIDLTIRPGELLFVVGGNGSGKTTLMKLLTGLYKPESGAILFDGEPVKDDGWEAYRQNFSAIFFDFFVFETLLGLDRSDRDLDLEVERLLIELELDEKVEIQDGVLSTTALSQGQRKRLALLVAYLEDRPIYVFDEWAADQDPLFKRVFYTEFLPNLKKRGKAVVVISHDDRYYTVADRIVKLEDGRLESLTPSTSLTPESGGQERRGQERRGQERIPAMA